MAMLIDGKAISMQIKDELKQKAAELKAKGINVTLAVIQVGDNPASCVYVRNKKKGCEYIGIGSLSYELPEETSQEELLNLIRELNGRDDVNGILVQLPLPSHIDEDTVIKAIDPLKDVDGFHPQSVGALNIDIAGKECVVLGRSNIVGKPMSLLLLRENATVTIAHSRTKNLKEVTQRADILVAAVGKPKMITKDYVKKGVVVVDVGINRDENNKLCGDVDFDDVEPVCSAITPVPGGVGPMTIAMLLHNCIESVSLKV